ncbi:VOC family protein [Nocardioides mangrovicus]|nr:VOC family protein [Nocardioides mangrovicus]
MGVTGMMGVTGIPNVGLHVDDVERSLAFYREVVGLETVVDSGWIDDPAMLANTATPGGAIRIVNLTSGGTGATITLVQVRDVERRTAPGGEFHDPGTMHLAMSVVDLDAALARLAEAGVTPLAEPGEVGAGNGAGHARIAFVRDPDGFFVELVQPLG